MTLGKTFAERQEGLQRWGFTCTCPLCSLPHAHRVASDVRRTLIAQADKKIIEIWKEGRHADAIALAEEIIEMIQEEGLEHFLTDEYALLAKLWLLYGKREKAEEIGKKSFEMLAGMGYFGNEVDHERWDLEKFLDVVGDGMKEVKGAP